MEKKTVAIGFLGPTLDAGKAEKRWSRWRPSVAMVQYDGLAIDRFVLFYQNKHKDLLEVVKSDIERVSPRTLVEPVLLHIEDPWDLAEVYNALHDFAVGFQFDTDAEDYLVHITTGTHIAQICLFILTESRHFPARLLQTQPSHDETKGPGTYAIIDLDLAKYDAIASRLAAEQCKGVSFLKSGIETRNNNFNLLIEKIERVAINSHEPLLLMGPTGSGKSQLAKRIYELKKHRHQITGNFVELNCATLRGDSAMSALFGHAKGAFTGAASDRAGLLKTANKGILFLDEIGELGLDEQAMLLRAIEEKTFLPMGSDRTVESDFELIAATNKDLRMAVEEKAFRADLLARINLWTFVIPGLVDRLEDLDPNIDYELDRLCAKTGKKLSFSKEARAHFLSFTKSKDASWKGNFRDLSASISRMSTLAHGGRIRVEDVDEEIARLKYDWCLSNSQGKTIAAHAQDETVPEDKGDVLDILVDRKKLENLDLFDRSQLQKTLEVCLVSKSLASAGRVLFATSRKANKHTNDSDRLRKYLSRHGITWGQLKERSK